MLSWLLESSGQGTTSHRAWALGNCAGTFFTCPTDGLEPKAYGLAHFQESKGPSFWRPSNTRSAIILEEGGKMAGPA